MIAVCASSVMTELSLCVSIACSQIWRGLGRPGALGVGNAAPSANPERFSKHQGFPVERCGGRCHLGNWIRVRDHGRSAENRIQKQA